MTNLQILIGNLGKSAEIRHMEGSRRKANFSVATNKTYTNREGQQITNTSWHNIVVWDPSLVEVAQKYCTKGRQIIVEGESTTRSYEDRNGNLQYVREIKATKLLPIDQMQKENKSIDRNYIAGPLAEKPVLQTNSAGEATCTLVLQKEGGTFPIELTGRRAEVAAQYLDKDRLVYVGYSIESTDPFKAVGTDFSFLGKAPSSEESITQTTSKVASEGNALLPGSDNSDSQLDGLPF